jgi:hypothetical protein
MHKFACSAIALTALVVGGAGVAAPPPAYGGGSAGRGWDHGHYGGGPVPYRPGYRWSGWGYGYPYAGFGYGLAVGAGWTLGGPWGWGWGFPAYGFGYPVTAAYGGILAPSVQFVLPEDWSYVQQSAVEPLAPAAASRVSVSYWYYCTEPPGYYPYVQQCSRPWIAVDPRSVAPAPKP